MKLIKRVSYLEEMSSLLHTPDIKVSLVIDFFGEHVSFHNTRQNRIVSCRLKVSKEAMKHWAVEHANIVKVVSPASLVESIREEVRKAAEMYDLV
jgi:hypothetical protein